MFTNVKAIIEFIKLLLNTYEFISGAIDEAKYNAAVKKRKKNYDKFISGSRDDRLDVLRDENEG
jgi:hypothetical protein